MIMFIYKNIRTGNVFESPTPCGGADIVPVMQDKKPDKKPVKKPAKKKVDK